ncbi:MAG: hypothetical protein IJX30_01190 [Clostridia bacterium]|nr:hypothetical protein [Clostridia bacterium]
MAEDNKKKRKRWVVVLSIILSVLFCFLAFGQIGAWVTADTLCFWRPDYAKENISSLLYKQELTEEDYELLYRQTGITKIGIEDMRGNDEGRKRILEIQNCLFADYDLTSECFGLFTYTEDLGTKEVGQLSRFVRLRDGDVLVSTSMHVSWWRLGHSALVINGDAGHILEAVQAGWVSEISPAVTFNMRANFIVLRPKVSKEVKSQVVTYAKENLVGLKYDLTTGVLSKKYQKTPKKSHCGHIVWRAYKQFGIDIDSNGGGVVTPEDMYYSEYMEVVQVFGLDLNLDKLW